MSTSNQRRRPRAPRRKSKPISAMRVAFLSPALPWSYGPYAQQLGLVAAGLARRGSHEIVWISMLSRMKNMTYSEEILQRGLEAVPPGEGGNPLKGVAVTYVGTGAAQCGGDGFYTGTLNALLAQHRVDALFSLMDHTRIFVDTPIRVPSFAWFPDHYVDLDLHHRHIFHAYRGVIALSPHSASKVRRVFPHKRVAWVPHIVSVDAPLRSRAEVRRRYGLSNETFLVFMAFGNYQHNGRKAIDTAMHAFRCPICPARDPPPAQRAACMPRRHGLEASRRAWPGADRRSASLGGHGLLGLV